VLPVFAADCHNLSVQGRYRIEGPLAPWANKEVLPVIFPAPRGSPRTHTSSYLFRTPPISSVTADCQHTLDNPHVINLRVKEMQVFSCLLIMHEPALPGFYLVTSFPETLVLINQGRRRHIPNTLVLIVVALGTSVQYRYSLADAFWGRHRTFGNFPRVSLLSWHLIDIDIFVNCNWVDTRCQYTFTHKQYTEQHN
jgi:hypothetical protein